MEPLNPRRATIVALGTPYGHRGGAWHTVEDDDELRARLNCISHILEQIPYENVLPEPLQLPPRPERQPYERPPKEARPIVPDSF